MLKAGALDGDLPGFIGHETAGDTRKRRQRNVRKNGLVQHQAGPLAILGDEPDAMRDCVRRALDRDPAAVDSDLSGNLPWEAAEQRHEKLGATRSHQTSNANHLAAMRTETNVTHDQLAANDRVFRGSVTRCQDHFSWRAPRAWEHFRNLPATHLPNHLLLV